MKHNLSLRNRDDARSKENILKKSAIVGKTEFYKKKLFKWHDERCTYVRLSSQI